LAVFSEEVDILPGRRLLGHKFVRNILIVIVDEFYNIVDVVQIDLKGIVLSVNNNLHLALLTLNFKLEFLFLLI